jgi:acetyl esterase/lipase
MPLQFDPEYYKAFEPLIPLLANRPELTVQDIQPSRKGREAGIAALHARLPESPDVEQAVYHCEATDGYQIPVHGFTKKDARPGTGPGPAILHFHGGGMILGSAELYAKPLACLVSDTSIPIFSVNYRLAPEHNGTTLVEDCYAALVWLSRNAQTHNIDPARIAVFGESAGGGLAAGVALIARDRNLQPPLAKQILVYPMLDDRNLVANEATEPFAFWKHKDNATAWAAVLGEAAGSPDADVSPYAAPARAASVADLPPTYIDVGEFDIFRDENLAYATRLLAQNISTEFHLYPGLPHAFELIAPNISATKKAYENRVKAMLSF